MITKSTIMIMNSEIHRRNFAKVSTFDFMMS